MVTSLFSNLQFSEADEAKRALDQLNGFELAGRLIKVGHVTERTDNPQDVSLLDSDELERTGIGMTQTGRLQLMAKLAEGKIYIHHADRLQCYSCDLAGQVSNGITLPWKCYILYKAFIHRRQMMVLESLSKYLTPVCSLNDLKVINIHKHH